MQNEIKLDPVTHSRVRDFFAKYQIRSIAISTGADISNAAVSQVEISFYNESDHDASAYVVSFKLLGTASDSHCFLQSIGLRQSKLQVVVAQAGRDLGSNAMASKLRAFMTAIESRVAKIYREQSIMGIKPLGKTFVLNNKTRFKVIADNGEGQLSIELLDKDDEREASLAANDLLDGLYVGLISLE